MKERKYLLEAQHLEAAEAKREIKNARSRDRPPLASIVIYWISLLFFSSVFATVQLYNHLNFSKTEILGAVEAASTRDCAKAFPECPL